MALRFKCSSCGQDVVVDSAMAGRAVQCGSCGAENQAPQSEAQYVKGKPRAALLSVEEEEKRKTALGAAMARDLRTWGIALIILGVVHIFAAKLLDPVWGIFIIVLGVVNLVVRHRAMFVVNGAVLLLIGCVNIAMSVSTRSYPWIVLGVLQIIWGITEIKSFRKYREI